MTLCAGQVVVGVPHIGTLLRGLFIIGYHVEVGLPLLGDADHLLVVLLVVERIAVVREYVAGHRGLTLCVLDELQAFLEVVDSFVQIAHVVVGITHRIVGEGLSVFVALFQRLGMHHLHLLEGRVHPAAEDVGVGQMRPGLIVVGVEAVLLVELHVAWCLSNERVVQVVVV